MSTPTPPWSRGWENLAPTEPIQVITPEYLNPPASTAYLINLIAALVASAGIVIGSSGPWVSVLVFSAPGTNGDGKITLTLGLISGVALSLAFFEKTRVLGCLLAIAAGALAFAVGGFGVLYIAKQEGVDFMGTAINAQIGWGLWLVLIGALTVTVTASVAFRQIPSSSPN